MRLVITKRGQKRIASNREYLEDNFYPEYAVAFSKDVLSSVELIPGNPEIGLEAFPNQNLPKCRKLLCKNRNWWIFYRIKRDRIEIISIKHILQNVRAPHNL